MDTSIPIPAKGILVLITCLLIISRLIMYGWKGNILVYLISFLVFNIFFDIVPYNNEPLTQTIQNDNNTQVVNCQKFKETAINNVEEYIKCKNNARPHVVCPAQLTDTKSIENKAANEGIHIQNEKYYANKQPNSDRVCGLIPGHKLNTVSSSENSSIKLLTDEEKRMVKFPILKQRLEKIEAEMKKMKANK